MNKSGKTILVTGATGHQGGATARHLLKEGWTVHCLVRDPNKPAARALAKAGATLVEGNFEDRASLDKALKGCYGLFSVQTPVAEGVNAEIEAGNQLADAAKAAGVKHLVYTSVAGADKKTGIPFFDSKLKIEQHLKSLGVPTTILRPVFFMENFVDYFPPSERQGTWVIRLPLKPDRKLQLIAVTDIGAFAALAFEHPEQYIGKTVELAGDELTMQQVTTLWSRVTGKTIKFDEQPIEEMRKNNRDYATMFDWFNKQGYTADIKGLKQKLHQLHTFEQWLNETHPALAGARH